MRQQATRVFYMPPPGSIEPTLPPGAEPLPASMSIPAPAVLRALSEMPAPAAAEAAPPSPLAVNPAPLPEPPVQETAHTDAILSRPQIPVEDWSPPEPAAASSLDEDLVRVVAMSAAQRKGQSSRRFSFFR
jgi:hypothetical protein